MLIDYFDNSQIIKFTGAGRATVYRWRANGAPLVLENLLKLIDGSDFSVIHKNWSGWGINYKTGELYSPNNDCFEPWQLLSLQYLHGALNGYKTKERQAREQQHAAITLPFKNRFYFSG